VHSLEAEGRISLTPDFECYAREIPGEVCESLGADEGDCALIVQRQAADEEGPGVLETDDGPLFIFFERDDVGNVHFTRPGVPEMDGELASARFDRDDEGNIHFSRRGVKVIGLPVGYVTALLRPAPPPEQPASPPEGQPVPTPPETPSEQELYDRLVQTAGDTDTADRLIEHERKRAPDASRREHIDTAIFRLVHDKE
jgi:hypothetical protein